MAPSLRFQLPVMSDRRSHPRFSLLPSPEGVLRVLRDVVVQSAAKEQLVLVGWHPGVRGELVSVHLPDDSCESVIAQVLESQPVVVDGTVRHQLRLRQLDGPAAPGRAVDGQRPFDE